MLERLTLHKERWARLGLGLGALFCLGIAWIGPEGLLMPSVALAPLWMMRQNFPASLLERLADRFSLRPAAAGQPQK